MLLRFIALILFFIWVIDAQSLSRSEPLVPFVIKNSCGYDKQCILLPNEHCDYDTCEKLLTWRTGVAPESSRNVVVYELAGNLPLPSPAAYLAVGFSADLKQGNDYIVACGWDGSSPFMRFGYYRSDGQVERLDRGYSYYRPYDNNVHYNPQTNRISCTFAIYRDVVPPSPLASMQRGAQFAYYFYSGTDPYLNDLPLSTAIAPPSEKRYYLAPSEDASREAWQSHPRPSPSAGVRAHAIFMLVSWMWLASIGILTARYMKTTFGSSPFRTDVNGTRRMPVFLDGQTWFQIHRSLQIAAVSLTVIAFVFIFIVCGRWVGPDYPYLPQSAHPILGCVVLALALLNFIFGWCAPRALTRERCVWNWFHWFIGSATHCIAVPTMFIGMSMKSWAWYAPIILFVWVIFHVIIEIILEIHSCCLACCYKESKKDVVKKDGEPLVFQTTDGKKVLLHTGPPPRRDGSTFRTIVWGIHVGVTSILAITLCFILALSG